MGYTYEFENLQVHFFDSAAINFVAQNAAAATTTGAETEIQWLPPIEGLNLHGALAYNSARYDDFLSFCYAGQSSAEGCNLDENGRPAAGQGTHQDLSDTPTPLSPEWAGGVGFLYERRLFDLIGRPLAIGLGADSSYTDTYLLSPLGRRDVRQESFFRTDASLRLFEEEGLWELAFIGRNLSNEYVVAVANVDSPLTGAATGTPAGVIADQIGVVNRPRKLGLQLSIRF